MFIKPLSNKPIEETCILMYKDTVVASIGFEGTVCKQEEALMPFAVCAEPADNLDAFYSWCISRGLALDKASAEALLSSTEFREVKTNKERTMLLLSYHCLCLKDCYWVRYDWEDVSFSDVNLFEDRVLSDFVEVAFDKSN